MTLVIVILSLAVSVVAGWAAVEGVLRLAKVSGGEYAPPSSGGHHATVLREGSDQPHVLRGGMWIGGLERLAITGAVLAGQPELIVAVVAVKGLGRWADLQTHPALTERFIIGTLASYVVAGMCGYAGLALMT